MHKAVFEVLHSRLPYAERFGPTQAQNSPWLKWKEQMPILWSLVRLQISYDLSRLSHRGAIRPVRGGQAGIRYQGIEPRLVAQVCLVKWSNHTLQSYLRHPCDAAQPAYNVEQIPVTERVLMGAWPWRQSRGERQQEGTRGAVTGAAGSLAEFSTTERGTERPAEPAARSLRSALRATAE